MEEELNRKFLLIRKAGYIFSISNTYDEDEIVRGNSVIKNVRVSVAERRDYLNETSAWGRVIRVTAPTLEAAADPLYEELVAKIECDIVKLETETNSKLEAMRNALDILKNETWSHKELMDEAIREIAGGEQE